VIDCVLENDPSHFSTNFFSPMCAETPPQYQKVVGEHETERRMYGYGTGSGSGSGSGGGGHRALPPADEAPPVPGKPHRRLPPVDSGKEV
jgi:hypothetical protein